MLAILGIAALLVGASIGSWLSIRGGQPATPPLYGTARTAPATLWTWDGNAYTFRPVPSTGPSSNAADMAYDRSRGLIVLWDHGCASMVMGFQGGCVAQVNRTWTWDGRTWTARQTQTNPTAAGPGAMLFDARLGRVVYVNGAGKAWTWGGADWAVLPLPGGPNIPVPGSATDSSAFEVGYDEGRDIMVFAVFGATWLWDGSRWTEIASGIDPGDARPDAHLVYDNAHHQLVYVGSHYTWTWDGTRWQQHTQPAIAAGTMGYDRVRATIMLVEPDTSACDRTACRTTTWTWDSATWTRIPIVGGPLLPLTRSGASAIPLAFDEARGVTVLFASAS
ncbi:MAG TPA: hypothetical protein VND96_00685 [Candidatus Micrarchaeaceae archaeon]|nr:hypothetical protein [Candidatus Micrarchaeaceae archaeon]